METMRAGSGVAMLSSVLSSEILARKILNHWRPFHQVLDRLPDCLNVRFLLLLGLEARRRIGFSQP